jgi:hypothetical protein
MRREPRLVEAGASTYVNARAIDAETTAEADALVAKKITATSLLVAGVS